MTAESALVDRERDNHRPHFSFPQPYNQATFMPDDRLRQQASSGDTAALENLLTGIFDDGQVEARVQLNRPKLQVILESPQPLDMKACIDRVSEAVAALSVEGLETLSIYSRQVGEYFPDWGQTLEGESWLASQPDYEFSSTENLVLGGLISRMRLTSYCLIGIGIALMTPGVLFFISGALQHVRGGVLVILPGLLQSFFPGILLLFDGVSKFLGSKKLALIVTTEGHDIEHLMAAVKLFRKSNGIMAWISGFSLAIAIVTVILFVPIFLALLEL